MVVLVLVMEEDLNTDALDSVDLQIKALRSASTRLRTDALRKVQHDIETGESCP